MSSGPAAGRTIVFQCEDQRLAYFVKPTETVQDIVSAHVSAWPRMYPWPIQSYNMEMNLMSGVPNAEPDWALVHEDQLLFSHVGPSQVVTFRLSRRKDESPGPEYVRKTAPDLLIGATQSPPATAQATRQRKPSLAPQPSPPIASTSSLAKHALKQKYGKKGRDKKERSDKAKSLQSKSLACGSTPASGGKGKERAIDLSPTQDLYEAEQGLSRANEGQSQQYSILSGPPPPGYASMHEEETPEVAQSAAIPLPELAGRKIATSTFQASESAVVPLPEVLPPLVLHWPITSSFQASKKPAADKKRKSTSSAGKDCTSKRTTPQAPRTPRKPFKGQVKSSTAHTVIPLVTAQVAQSTCLTSQPVQTLNLSLPNGPKRQAIASTSSAPLNLHQNLRATTVEPKREPRDNSGISLSAIDRLYPDREGSMDSLDEALNAVVAFHSQDQVSTEDDDVDMINGRVLSDADADGAVAEALIPPRVVVPRLSGAAEQSSNNNAQANEQRTSTTRIRSRSRSLSASAQQRPKKMQLVETSSGSELGQEFERYAALGNRCETDGEEDEVIYEPAESSGEEEHALVEPQLLQDKSNAMSPPSRKKKRPVPAAEKRNLRDRQQADPEKIHASSLKGSNGYGTYKHHKYGDHGRFCIWDDWVKQGVKTVKQAKQKIEADVGVDANDVYVLLGPRVMEDSEKLPLARNLDIFFREDSRDTFWDEPGTKVTCTIGSRAYIFQIGESEYNCSALVLWEKLDEAMRRAGDGELSVGPTSHALENSKGYVWNNMMVGRTFRSLKESSSTTRLQLNVVPAEEVDFWVANGKPGVWNKRIKCTLPLHITLGAAKPRMLEAANLAAHQGHKDFSVKIAKEKTLLTKDDQPFFALDGVHEECTVRIDGRERKKQQRKKSVGQGRNVHGRFA